MSITPEQARQVAKILHPDWDSIAGENRFSATRDGRVPINWFAYDPTTPAECWAMVLYIANADIYGRDNSEALIDALQSGLTAKSLMRLVLAIGGDSGV
tara:strand:+ start:52 stop:348 length:297 start_codon:yes stop_codon:yes gene_type:complete